MAKKQPEPAVEVETTEPAKKQPEPAVEAKAKAVSNQVNVKNAGKITLYVAGQTLEAGKSEKIDKSKVDAYARSATGTLLIAKKTIIVG